MTSSWQSIRRRLPTFTVALIAVVAAVVTAVAYHQMKETLLESAGERASSASTQVARMLTGSYAQIARGATPLSRDSVIVAALERRSPDAIIAASRRLQSELSSDSLIITAELWDLNGKTLVGAGAPLPATETRPAGAQLARTIVEPILARRNAVLTDLHVPVFDAHHNRIGVVRKLSRISSGQTRQLLGGLIGDDARLLLGNADGGIWTDLRTRVPRPSGAATRDAQASTSIDGRRWIGAGVAVPGTPWAVWVGLPEDVVLAPLDVLLQRILIIVAAVLIVVGIGVWRLAVYVITPVVDLTAAAESLAAGNHDVRARVTRENEIGRLAAAFNAMASAIQTSNEELRHNVEEATRARRAAERLQTELQQSQKMEAVGRLAGGVAHDFNNILTVVMSYSDIMLSGGKLDDSLRPHVLQVREAANRAAALTRQLLAFSRKQVLRPAPLDVNEAIGGVFGMLSRVMPATIKLRTELDPSVGSIFADRGQIDQVLMNLAVNARDAMPSGGTLTIATSMTVIDDAFLALHGTGKPGPHVVLTISDTGVGMDAPTRERVFEPFFTTKASGKGTGLGLATVYGIIEQSGGSVYVYSEPGLGATFKLCFPVYDQAPVVPSIAPSETEPGTALRVLLVEDDPLVRGALAQVLARVGHTVTGAHDAANALETLRGNRHEFDIVITDVVMPGQSGLELAEIIRRERPGLPVVLMSGYSEEAVNGGVTFPADTVFVEKPFTAQDITAAIGAALGGVSVG